jgi:hypothetical protein
MFPLAAPVLAWGLSKAKGAAGDKLAASGIGGKVAGIISGHPKDAQRIKEARENGDRAVRGDVNAAELVLRRVRDAATAVGRDANRAAWDRIKQEAPAIAAQALRNQPPEFAEVASGGRAKGEIGRNALATELDRLAGKIGETIDNATRQIRNDTADTVQRVAAGGGAAAADAIDGDGSSRISIPTDKAMLLMVVAVVALLAFVALRRGR